MEGEFRSEDEYSYLISAVSQILEVERLIALAAPHASDLTIEAEPQFADQPRLRDLSPTATVPQRPLRLGDNLRFACRTNAACRVVLIDVGTSGTVAVVLPNFAMPDARAVPGQILFVPDGNFPGLAALKIAGQPGRERLLALALRSEEPGGLRPPLGTSAFVGRFGRFCPGSHDVFP
jgi:hypothetical protein